jgi:hypothetical protein
MASTQALESDMPAPLSLPKMKAELDAGHGVTCALVGRRPCGKTATVHAMCRDLGFKWDLVVAVCDDDARLSEYADLAANPENVLLVDDINQRNLKDAQELIAHEMSIYKSQHTLLVIDVRPSPLKLACGVFQLYLGKERPLSLSVFITSEYTLYLPPAVHETFDCVIAFRESTDRERARLFQVIFSKCFDSYADFERVFNTVTRSGQAALGVYQDALFSIQSYSSI